MEEIISLILVIVGSVNMVANIVAYTLFALRMNDVTTRKNKANKMWLIVGESMLVFFLIGYIIVGIVFDATLLTALILFFGSAFVTIMLLLVSRLIESVKQKSFEITQLLVDVVDARDPNLNGHSSHVKEITINPDGKLCKN